MCTAFIFCLRQLLTSILCFYTQCCGTITNPDLLFLDEITSGLDGFAALQVMNLVRKLADKGMVVICRYLKNITLDDL